MKKTLFLILGICIISIVQAQTIKPSQQISKPVIQKPGGNTNQTNTPQTTSTPTTPNDADYFLSVARVTLKTGKDNKELNSKLIVSVYPNYGTDNYKKGFTMLDYMPELKVWSSKDFTLPKAPGYDQSFNSLANYKKGGVMVDILYNTLGNGPFFGLDAWKLDEVSAVLEFKDKNGNPHPTMPSKTVYFTESSMYLDYAKWHLYCKTDEFFNTLPCFITKRDN